ncbi:MAG TPA: twin-arginine translocase TatA/TatE family subunit [Solirubrobacterales bacterium]|jgi:sec-independent protein translocase protein TatA|nr:twin-arginine translocase TatA/TatE family subunit [Solirubrobacterales bacterium]
MTGLENPTHILFVLIVAVLVLGPKRLPSVGRSLGAGIREFRDSLSDRDEERSDRDDERGS